jgi:hypothetical protein
MSNLGYYAMKMLLLLQLTQYCSGSEIKVSMD